MVPSQLVVASQVNYGWNAMLVIGLLCPFISNLAGNLGRYKSSIFKLATDFPLLLAHLANSSSKLATFSSKLVIFFCKLNIDFHLIISLLPSGSTLSRDSSTSSANAAAVLVNQLLDKYQRRSLWSWVFWVFVNIKFFWIIIQALAFFWK